MGETFRGAAESAFAELHDLHGRLNAIYDQMGAPDADLDKLLKQQADIERRIDALGGYAIDHKIDAALRGVGFEDAQFPIYANSATRSTGSNSGSTAAGASRSATPTPPRGGEREVVGL